MAQFPSKRMGEERARFLTERIRGHALHIRSYLYEIFKAEGYKSLGYDSMRQYLLSEFQHEFSYPYLTRQIKAAQLEEMVGADIGSHKESHLRPLIEGLDESDRLDLYGDIDFGTVTAAQIKEIVDKERVNKSGLVTLAQRMIQGEVSPRQAVGILDALPVNSPLHLIELVQEVSDPKLVPILSRLSDPITTTYQEILLSRTIQAFPDPIPISQANASTLLAWLDVSSAEHRAISIQRNREKYGRIGELVSEIISNVREIIHGKAPDTERLSRLVKEYDYVKNDRVRGTEVSDHANHDANLSHVNHDR